MRAKLIAKRALRLDALEPWVAVAATLTLLGAIHVRNDGLGESDLYFHARASAELARQAAPLRAIPQASESVFATERFSDKDFLHHVLLAFVVGPADDLFEKIPRLKATYTILGALPALSAIPLLRALGVAYPGTVVALTLATSAGFLARSSGGRPHLLGIALLFLLLWALVRSSAREPRGSFAREPTGSTRGWIFALSAIAPLAHTSWVLLPFFAGLRSLALWVTDRPGPRRTLEPFGLALAGSALGVLVHPGFPKNLEQGWLQNALFLTLGKTADADLVLGGELLAPSLSLLAISWFGTATTLALFYAAVPAPAPAARERVELGSSRARASGANAVFLRLSWLATLGLALRMNRFAEYFAPMTGALLAHLASTGSLPILGMAKAPRARLAAGVAAGLSLALYLNSAQRWADVDSSIAAEGPFSDFRGLAAALGKLPDGALVFHCAFEDGALIYFMNPRLRFLYALDPSYMRARDREKFRRLESACRAPGVEQGVADRLKAEFRTPYFLVDATRSPTITAALVGDPKVKTLFRGVRKVLLAAE